MAPPASCPGLATEGPRYETTQPQAAVAIVALPSSRASFVRKSLRRRGMHAGAYLVGIGGGAAAVITSVAYFAALLPIINFTQ